ncbi:MAG TPA: glutamate formimidoyltransferase [Vicinamibacterales bacterium]|nr:glutamate formimidoyltransferase [Vicinamibacterales bacterium]
MLVECVANVSEGRRPAVISACAGALERAGARLLDVSSDPSHNRSVFSFAGSPDVVRAAATALFEPALAAIDLRHHTGVHPRIGAVDVVPFVPLEGATMADAIALARAVGADVAARHALPVFLYAEAATRPDRRRLEHIRRGQFEGLTAKLATAGWEPDFGPSAPHRSAGATAVGARGTLVAFNVNLATDRLDLARQIARTVRESSGGLPAVKALGVALTDRGIVQVAMNLVDVSVTPVAEAFEAVLIEATRLGLAVLESELIGLVPEAALDEPTARALRIRDWSRRRYLETRLRETTG